MKTLKIFLILFVCLVFIIAVFLYVSMNSDSHDNPDKLLGVDVRLFMDTEAWPLAEAIDEEDVEEMERLISENKNLLNFKEPTYRQTLLMWAVNAEKYNAAKKLLELGADPNICSEYDGDNALMFAADNWEDTRYLKLLLSYGANPNDTSGKAYGREITPLMMAVTNSNLENVKLLVEAGANINYRSEVAGSVLQKAALMSQVYNVKYLLIDKSCEFNYPFEIYVSYNGKRVDLPGVDKRKKFLVDYMRDWTFDIGSDKWKCKMEIVKYLKERGMDYDKAPISETELRNYTKEYCKLP